MMVVMVYLKRKVVVVVEIVVVFDNDHAAAYRVLPIAQHGHISFIIFIIIIA
jgi:hypothetical protein